LIETEIQKLISSKDFYDRLRGKTTDLEAQTENLNIKLDAVSQKAKNHVKNLENQADSVSLELRDTSEGLKKKQKTIFDAQEKSNTVKNAYEKKFETTDTSFIEESTQKDEELRGYLENIKNAQKEMDLLVEGSVKNRENMFKKLEDVQRQVINAKDPKFNMNELKYSEKEQSNLK